MKKILFILFFSIGFSHVFAAHLKGGWMYYEYLGPGINDPSKLRYKLVLKQYMVCNATGSQISAEINFSIFNAGTNFFITNVAAPVAFQENIQNHPNNPCIQNEPTICYKIVTYEAITELAPTPEGYLISKQQCCRIDGITNILNSGGVGATYVMQIPGTALGQNAEKNSSAQFAQKDTVTVCGNSYFEFPFSCTDEDGDELKYSFCDAFDGGSQNNPQPVTSASPPYFSVPYALPYNGEIPLGNGVTIDPVTGLMSGIAPPPGVYVVTVCCYEFRNGVLISVTRKELHISSSDCIPLKAQLDPTYITCDGLTYSFANKVFIDPNSTYEWEFGDPVSGINNFSSSPTPSHTFSDAGTYMIKLKVSLNGLCGDSTTAIVKVFPGFFPGFTNPDHACTNFPVNFTDVTNTNHGIVNSWSWDFGDPDNPQDKSILQNPAYTYTQNGQYDVTFIVSNSIGCIDTVVKSISVIDKPPLQLTSDTLICVVDDLPLTATGTGTILWTPNYNIDDVNSFTPVVSPDVPTMYYARLTDIFGCFKDDSVYVDVKAFVTLQTGNDTTICQTDAFIINTAGDALHYKWTPAAGLSSDIEKSPVATPLITTLYHVTGNIGSCQSDDEILVTVVPYPVANAGNDTSICFGTNAQLNASGGSDYLWSPPNFLSNTTISNPEVIKPTKSMQYVVTVNEELGCPKPVKDTVLVNVIKVMANAGPSDTSVVEGEPLQLNGTGGVSYTWSPATWLSNTGIATPVALPQDDIEYKLLVKSAEGCEGTDSIYVKFYKVKPDLYVPSAFTPNSDGLNDVIKPILLGMKELKYFRVYNRWGQLVFSTSAQGKGWDGTIAGKPQDGGTYTWVAEGLTYKGTVTQQKGYVVLIR